MIEESDLQTIGKEPLSSERPCGEDLFFNDDYKWIQTEITKLNKAIVVSNDDENDGSDQPIVRWEPVDWDGVIERSVDLLKGSSKDLWLVSWLSMGLTVSHGAYGVATGLSLTAELLENFWETVYPGTPIGKARAIKKFRDFCFDRLNDQTGIEPLSLSEDDCRFLRTALDAIERLNITISEKTEGKLGPFADANFNRLKSLLDTKAEDLKPKSKIKKFISEVVSSGERQDQTQDDASGSPESGKNNKIDRPQPVETPSAKTYDFSDITATRTYVASLKESSRQIQIAAIEGGMTDPLPFRWIRIVYWSPLNISPDVKQVSHPGPNAVLSERLEGLYRNGSWRELFKVAEQQFANYFLWLDLQRYVCEAAEGLGAKFHDIASAIKLEIDFLLLRMPHLATFTMLNNEALATIETQEWIREISSIHADIESDEHRGSGLTKENTVSDKQGSGQELINFFSEKRVDETLEKARALIRSASSGIRTFEIELELSDVLMQRKEIQLAYYYLDHISQLVDQHKLDIWDPDLAVAGLKGLHRCCIEMARVKKESRAEFRARASDIVRRVSMIDPLAASKLVTK